MSQLDLVFTRENEPPAFRIHQERILDAMGTVQIGLREGGMESGRASVTIVIPLSGGMCVVLEQPWRLWKTALESMENTMAYWKENPL